MAKIKKTLDGDNALELVEEQETESSQDDKTRHNFFTKKVQELYGDAMKTHDPIGFIRGSLQDTEFNTIYSDDDILDMIVGVDDILNNK